MLDVVVSMVKLRFHRGRDTVASRRAAAAYGAVLSLWESRSGRKLEGQLGVKTLFDRSARLPELTDQSRASSQRTCGGGRMSTLQGRCEKKKTAGGGTRGGH